MMHFCMFIYILSFFSGVICISIFMLYKKEFPRFLGIEFKVLKKFLIAFFCFFAVNFLIFYNEYFIECSIAKVALLVVFDILLILSLYYLIKLNCIGNEYDTITQKVFLPVGILYIAMWFSVYFLDFSWFPPLKPIIEFVADAILSSVTTGILILFSIFQQKRNRDLWEKKYLITLNIIVCVYACLLYCADLFTELSKVYVSVEMTYPYMYEPLFIVFIAVNIYTATYIVISTRKIRDAEPPEIMEETDSVEGVIKEVSEREKEVVDLIVKGMNNAEIAEELCISVYTVKRHINSIFKKLEVKNRFELLCKVQNKK